MNIMTKLDTKRNLNSGITLIALVITIIILLILAGVSIAMLTGENGILKKATTAKEQTSQASAEEKVKIAVYGSYDTSGRINIDELNSNLENIEGIDKGGLPIAGLPATVVVDGVTILIGENGKVEISGPTAIIQEVKLVDSTGEEVTGENRPEEGQEGYQASFKVALTEAGTINSVTYNGTEITGTNGEYKIPVTENKTYKVSINYTINGKTETKERDVVVKDLFKATEPINAGDIASNEETFKKVAGGKVLNYGTDSEIEWKVFYADNNGIYLIASDYVPVSKLASQKTSLGFTDNGSYNIYWSSSSDFKVTAIDDEIASKFMLNEKSKFTASNPNYQMTACLLNTANWETFRDARWADENNVIGEPTLEMYVASWNKKYPENKLYTKADGRGYYVGTSENPTTVYIDMSNTVGYQDELYYPHREAWNKCSGYWLASPVADSNDHEIVVSYRGGFDGCTYNGNYNGVRPLVHLKSNVKIKPQGENFVLE